MCLQISHLACAVCPSLHLTQRNLEPASAGKRAQLWRQLTEIHPPALVRALARSNRHHEGNQPVLAGARHGRVID
eukprot:CAMPEP_0119374784 /NCGR_PEP_ID=MMETSP1334-20130426/32897_1 /TAXON_ID=127549 /ORGANISM="Calcidiscus leptoporus, Strain RCC1130" /LENGTH=74 /DNA_ID=CAMNT_0007392945 /DNA_START=206 /DNA_END=427 /DNA_ORIENTATION=+